MVCGDSLTQLRNIGDHLTSLHNLIIKYFEPIPFRGIQDGWNKIQIGKSLFYERVITYAGAPGPVTYQLYLKNSSQVNRIEQVWNDATAKDISIRAYPNISGLGYVQLQTLTTDTNTSELLQLGTEFKYPAGARIDFVYENFTNAKTVQILLQADEL